MRTYKAAGTLPKSFEYGRCRLVPVWTSAVHEEQRVVCFPTDIMETMQPCNGPPRQPTSEELEELLQWQITQRYARSISAEEREDERGLVESSWIGVFDDYITDGPGYAGRVMFVVWPGSPSMFHVFACDHVQGFRVVPFECCSCYGKGDCEE